MELSYHGHVFSIKLHRHDLVVRPYPFHLNSMYRVSLTTLLCAFMLLVDLAAQDLKTTSTRTIVIRSLKPTRPSPTVTRYGITRDDVRRIKDLLPSVRWLVPIREHPGAIRVGERVLKASICGTSDDYIHLGDLEVDRGRFLVQKDNELRNNVAVISSAHAAQLFPEQDPIGQTIRISNEVFTIVGVVESESNLPVFVPHETMRARLGDIVILRDRGTFEARHYELSELWIETHSSEQWEKTVQVTTAILRKYHDQEDFEIRLKR